MFTSWVQGTTHRLLASVTIVDYAGAVGELFTPSIPSFLTPLCPVLDTYVEPAEDVVSDYLWRFLRASMPSTRATIAPPSMAWSSLTSLDTLVRDDLRLSRKPCGPK